VHTNEHFAYPEAAVGQAGQGARTLAEPRAGREAAGIFHGGGVRVRVLENAPAIATEPDEPVSRW
jgi:hypothetical protein